MMNVIVAEYEERLKNIWRENVERLMMKADNDIKFKELLSLSKGMV